MATAVKYLPVTIATMVDLAKRLELAMAHKRVGLAALAKGAGLSYQGVRKVVRGETKSMLTATAKQIGKFCGVNSHWLATGEGTMVLWDGALSGEASSPSSASATLTVGADTPASRELADALQLLAGSYDRSSPLVAAQVKPLFSMLFEGVDKRAIDSGTIAQRIAELLAPFATPMNSAEDQTPVKPVGRNFTAKLDEEDNGTSDTAGEEQERGRGDGGDAGGNVG